MAPSKWTEISNAFAPFDPVPPERLDEWFVTRPDSPFETMIRNLSPDRLPERRILVGQPASGKSSELTNLAAELKKRYDTLVVRFDMTDMTDVERANPVDVLFLMGAAIFKVASEELPPDHQPDRQLLEAHKTGLETLVQTHTKNKEFEINLDKLLAGLVAFGGAVLAGPAGAAAGGVVGRLNPFRFRSGTNTEVVRRLEVEPNVEAMIDSLNAIIGDAEEKSGGSLVLVVDGLDKLRDPDVIRLNFLEKDFLSRPTCGVIYAGPLDLYYSPEFGGVRVRFPITPFSHVRLYAKDDRNRTSEDGYEAMRELVRRRLDSLGFEPRQIVADDVLDKLITGSGGVMRDFVRVVQNAATYADIAGGNQIGHAEAGKALNELRRQLQAQLTPNYHEVLQKVRETNQRVDSDESDLLLRNDVVLGFFNDDVWYDAHAALTDQPW